jgi:hypothetical protein
MKIILIIQSLIIVAGAYYLFTLNHEVVTEVQPVVVETLPETPAATTTDEAVTTRETDVSSDIAGPNDAGMEWPTIEGELEVR